MKIFKLPDLGEGLPDAVIREWYVKVGEDVKVDQPLVSMETAKALVDVPAPYSGKIEKLFGQAGDTIETGNPLIGFEGEAEPEQASKDSGTVVGAIEESETVIKEAASGVSPQKTQTTKSVKATPAVRMLAKQLGVDLASIISSGEFVTAEDVKQAATIGKKPGPKAPIYEGVSTPLSQARRAMVLSMTQSHDEIVPVTLTDDADLYAWKESQDITIRLIRAMQHACETEPLLNNYFDSSKMALVTHKSINIGLAVDTPHGLYVPVLKDVANMSDESLRSTIERFKTQAQDRSFPKEDLQGATIMLSNFGAFAGRYATPIIVPPMVAIVAVGRAREAFVPGAKNQPEVHRILPISVTTDHRVITGGETARFLKALLKSLAQPR